ncbi:MAG: L,D-transpeptidase/peptidoglycan binding protein, partial [Lachnospiraceae bacterium]|nr:L,D-transpeptidase/peptidoglycan binding protein [Lachnospiraceae bacterium]
VLKGSVIGGLIILLSLIAMYLGLVFYYDSGFSYGTWINGVDCTGKSVNEVNEELLKQCKYTGLTILDSDGKSYAVLADEVNLSVTFDEPLHLYLEGQNPYLWIDNLIGNAGGREISPVIRYDSKTYEQLIGSFPFFQGKAPKDRTVRIIKTDGGYALEDERTHVLNEEKTKEMIQNAFENFEPVLDLEAAGCYEDLPLDAEMKKTIMLWEKLADYQDCGIIYQFGEETVPIDAGVVCDFIMLDEAGAFVLDRDGNLCTDEEKVYEFVDHLADEYDTVGATRSFKATRGELVTVKGGTYGNKIDREAEKEYLLNAFLDKRREVHEPLYLQTAVCQGRNDIGDTYIEVDMTNQMMYYYEDGELKIETPVVTGNTSLRRGTPAGTNFVYSKERDRILRGEDYASPVKYWIPVKGAIGIHDASWRSRYGGEIYKTNGSHGCINTPLDKVAELYEMVEIGTPCVMFY